jgi:hypothetical protein
MVTGLIGGMSFLAAACLGAAAFTGASAQDACNAVTHSGDEVEVLMGGYMPTFQNGAALPAIGIFDLILQPVANVIYPARFELTAPGGYGGIVTIESVPAGQYRIIFSGAMRVDAVQHWSLLLSQPVTPHNKCTGLRAVEVEAGSGPLTVQFSGSVTPQVSVAIIRL